jgi:hypothetical protein
MKARTGFIWLSSGLLSTRQWANGLYKRLRTSRVAKQVVASGNALSHGASWLVDMSAPTSVTVPARFRVRPNCALEMESVTFTSIMQQKSAVCR